MKYRLWYVPQIGMGKTFDKNFDSLLQAVKTLDVIYQLALFEYDNHVRTDYANVGGVEYFDVREQEWYSVDPDALEFEYDYAEEHRVTPTEVEYIRTIL